MPYSIEWVGSVYVASPLTVGIWVICTFGWACLRPAWTQFLYTLSPPWPRRLACPGHVSSPRAGSWTCCSEVLWGLGSQFRGVQQQMLDWGLSSWHCNISGKGVVFNRIPTWCTQWPQSGRPAHHLVQGPHSPSQCLSRTRQSPKPHGHLVQRSGWEDNTLLAQEQGPSQPSIYGVSVT